MGQASNLLLMSPLFQVWFHPLDIDCRLSIESLRDYLVKEYGGLDVLVNNAGIYPRKQEGLFTLVLMYQAHL